MTKKPTLSKLHLGKVHLHENLVLDLGQIVKTAVEREGMLGWQFNTIGVSDAITMGGEGEFLLSLDSELAGLDAIRHALLPPGARDHRRLDRVRHLRSAPRCQHLHSRL